ncbi:hypothetical protein DFP73DRAFT_592160 [Morchella snyderi]|nr:hypothetical protein DFP73DRAFT_592160 [Morchella snyderi]
MSGQIHCEFHHVGLPKGLSKTAIHLLGRNTASQCFDHITTASALLHVFSAPPSSPMRDDLVYRTSYHAEEGLIVLAYMPHAEGEGKLDVRSSGDSRFPYGYKISFNCPVSKLLEIEKLALQFVTSASKTLENKNPANNERDTNSAFQQIHKLVENACRIKVRCRQKRTVATSENLNSPIFRIPVTPKSNVYPTSLEGFHEGIPIPEPIPINWGVRSLLGPKIVRKHDSQPSSQKISRESHAENRLTAVTPHAITLRSIITVPEIKVIPRKRRLPGSFSTTTRDRKRLCVDLSIHIESQHSPEVNLVHGDHDILDQDQGGAATVISQGVINDDISDVPLKTGPSWQDLRRLPCGRVCFDPAFYGC